MIPLFSMEFWLGATLFINFLLLLSVWFLVRKLRKNGICSSVNKDQVASLSALIYRETIEKLEARLDNLADKAAVQMVDRGAQDILDLLDPLVKGSESTAATFDGQIKDKQRLIRELNDALDARIISINLLISRAETVIGSSSSSLVRSGDNTPYSDAFHPPRPMGGKNANFSGINTFSEFKDRDAMLRQNAAQTPLSGEEMLDQQQRILDLYAKGLGADEIAAKIAMPRGEVQLVIDLKEKFIQMEHRF